MKLAKAKWRAAVLVCGKCSKRVGGGFGAKGRTPLAKALRKEDGFGKGRKAEVGVTEVKCLGLCPRAAVTVVDTRRPGDWLVVAPGEDVGALAERLLSQDHWHPAHPEEPLSLSKRRLEGRSFETDLRLRCAPLSSSSG